MDDDEQPVQSHPISNLCLLPPKFLVTPLHRSIIRVLPDVPVSAIDVITIVVPTMLMARTVMMYLLSSLRSLRVYDLVEPSEIVSVRGAPCGAEHLLTV